MVEARQLTCLWCGAGADNDEDAAVGVCADCREELETIRQRSLPSPEETGGPDL